MKTDHAKQQLDYGLKHGYDILILSINKEDPSNVKSKVIRKGFWLPGTGTGIENHIPVLREGNKKIAFPFFGKGNLSSQYLYIG